MNVALTALVFGIGGYLIGYLSRREDETHHRPAMEAERKGYVFFRGIRRERLSNEPWATEQRRDDALREAGLI